MLYKKLIFEKEHHHLAHEKNWKVVQGSLVFAQKHRTQYIR
jgi:hypothetical protein